MRGFGDSGKPAGTGGYDAGALAQEAQAIVRRIGFGGGRPVALVAHDMGAPPALLWAAGHPDEIAGLICIEAPVMLSEALTETIAYTPEAMRRGSMWWWILPLAPGVRERLVVGNERAFLTWFHEVATDRPSSIEPAAVDEVLRTFRGAGGMLGAMGVYRAAFTSIGQTEPLARNGAAGEEQGPRADRGARRRQGPGRRGRPDGRHGRVRAGAGDDRGLRALPAGGAPGGRDPARLRHAG